MLYDMHKAQIQAENRKQQLAAAQQPGLKA